MPFTVTPPAVITLRWDFLPALILPLAAITLISVTAASRANRAAFA